MCVLLPVPVFLSTDDRSELLFFGSFFRIAVPPFRNAYVSVSGEKRCIVLFRFWVINLIRFVCISEARAVCSHYANLFVHLVRFARSTCLWLICMFVRNDADPGVGLHVRCF